MFNEVYNDWNHKRAKAIIDHYGYRFFHGKRILDLGAGHGDIAASLSRLGADITCVDVRQENLDILSKKHPHLKTMKIDLDYNWPFFDGQFDMVLSLGLLCHLKDHISHLENICSIAEHIVLETEVLDSIDANSKISIFEDKHINDLSFHGEGSIVSASNIQNRLSEIGAKFKRVDDPKLNSGPYRYDWQGTNAGRIFGGRRLWFVRLDKFIVKKMANQILINEAERAVNIPTPIQVEIPPQNFEDFSSTVFSTLGLSPAPPLPINSSENPFVRTPKQSVQKGDSVIRLFYNYYEDKDGQRKNEIDICLRKNISNNLLDVVVFESQEMPTFDVFFEKINAVSGPNDINIICSPDIYFDETIILANNIHYKEMYALTCWDVRGTNNIVFRNEASSQDAWIVRGKIENVFGGFQLGNRACDNRLAYEFHKAKYKVMNPSKSIRSYHYHISNINHYSSHTGVPGPHLFVLPTEFSK